MKKKLIIIFMILVIIINVLLPIVQAKDITKADLIYDHKITTHIKFYNSGEWYDIKCGYICYMIEQEKFPAYCISHGLHGVDEEGSYTVLADKLLDNKLIYNTIINGYPYRTPEQLGVETADDAYVATKQAVNSVVLDRDVKSFYKPADEKGNKIINAIYDISEKGKKGNDVNKEAKINIQEIGNLIEEENCYYQEYRVNADRAISQYSVDCINNFPEGSFICDTNKNKKNTFNSNESFRIYMLKEKLDKDICGEINVTAYCNAKPIFYGEAPKSTIQNYAITYKPYVEYKGKTNVEYKMNTGSIKVIKKDEETKLPIKDTQIGLYRKDGVLLDILMTDKDGIAIFKDLYQGEYDLKEENANVKYIKSNDTFETKVELEKETVEELTNKHKKGSLKITKVDKDDNRITLGAIEFDLMDEKGNIIQHLVTDINGEVIIENINIGTYTLKETKTKKEYNLCIDKNISVEWNKISEIIIENEKQKGQINIIKEDAENNNIKLEGVIFEIIDNNNKIVERITSSSNGEALSSKLLIGKYKIKEVDLGGNDNYILDNQEYEVEIENNHVTEIHIQNKHKKGNLNLKKVDKDNNKINLSEVEFDLLDSKNNIVKHLQTDNNGEIHIDNINIGNYVIKETKCRSEYNLSNDKLIEIKWNETANLVIENEKKKGKIEIYKADKEDESIKIEGVEFLILDEENNIIDKLKTNYNGYAISKKIPIGEYYLKEEKTNEKYLLEEKTIKAKVEEETITTLNVKNSKKKGKIEVVKVSSGYSKILNLLKGSPLSENVFEIYDQNNKIVDTIKTDEAGIAISKSLEVGRYKVKEKYATRGFILNNNEFIVNITKNDQIEKIEVVNDPIIPLIEIKKIGQEYAENNEEIMYSFNIENKSNCDLDKLTCIEYLPYNQVITTKIITGTYNEKLDYKIYFKTNKSDYRLLKELNTYKSEYIDLDEIKLEDNEKIVELKIEYDNVKSDFKSIVSPNIFVKINNNLKKNEKILNTVELIGNIQNFEVKDKSYYETIIKEKENIKKLPKTGC